jgi:hypothetical protein
MLSRGIVFYITGNKINHQIPVALYTLTKYYTGNICFVVDHKFSNQAREKIETVPRCMWVQDILEHRLHTGKRDTWCRKAWHHTGQYPYNINLYYDLDHMWRGPFDYSVFDYIEEKGLVCATDGKRPFHYTAKKQAAERCIRRRLDTFHAVNGGCVGCVYKSDAAKAIVDTMKETRKDKRLRRNPEEFALAILEAQGIAAPLSYAWSRPVGANGGYLPNRTDTLHFPRKGYLKCKEWCLLFKELYDNDYLSIRTEPGAFNVHQGLLNTVEHYAVEGFSLEDYLDESR